MKLSDYVVKTLAEDYGVRDIFLVSGGGIMHLLDSVGSHPAVKYHCVYHEQAAVVAAEGYARWTGKLGVALVTVGPGAANAASALPGAWVDSVPLLVLAGQVRSDLIADYGTLRQKGPQEANTLDMARPVTKYAQSVRAPEEVRAEIDRAVFHACSGRPGPVWLEFPVDITGTSVEESALPRWNAPPLAYEEPGYVRHAARTVADAIRSAERPLIIAGNGVRLAGAQSELKELLAKTGLPVSLVFTAKDVVAEDSPSNVGIFGTAGQRRANFAVQNADLLIGLGAGFNVQKVGFNVAGFAPKAKKLLVDIDQAQLRDQVLKPDIAVQADVKALLPALIEELEKSAPSPSKRWIAACAEWKKRYPLITSDYFADQQHVNSYVFCDALSEALHETDTLVTGNGLDVVSVYQAFRVKVGQRVFLSGWGSMGWDLPLSIGAAIASGKRVVLVTGDGSIQWNIQELLTIQRYRLPIKIFIFNNAGYSSIRATQKNFFDGRFVGSDFDSGVATPDFAALAAAYGMGYSRIENNSGLETGIRDFLGESRAGFCELLLAHEQTISPRASAYRREDGTFESRPLEDMAPFLPREEIYENMHLFEDRVNA